MFFRTHTTAVTPPTPSPNVTVTTSPDPPTSDRPTTSLASSDSSDTPTTSSTTSESSSQTTPTYAVVIIIVLGLTVIIILAVIAVVLILHCRPLRFSHLVKGSSSIMTSSLPVDSYSDPSLNELLEDSGSGSGLPLLIQRSISGQITLHNLIGKGRFGEVWKGLYKGDYVAVKIFHTKEELSWFHEVEIYQTCLLRHPNVLRFIAADNKDVGLQMQLWLITEFCDSGSLFDLLSRETLTQVNALKLCFTAVCGIDHLHTEIFGTHGKPSIAHRDLKSRNILVKGDHICCIADLGLSLTYEQATGSIKQPPRTTVGTRRYLAPEVLTESIAVKNFESFKRSDIYSFALVMWEIGRRAECNGRYSIYLNRSLSLMSTCVCVCVMCSATICVYMYVYCQACVYTKCTCVVCVKCLSMSLYVFMLSTGMCICVQCIAHSHILFVYLLS